MSHTLISFLGRVRKGVDGYQKTAYRFPNDTVSEKTAFIGWSLFSRLKPDHMVIFGTSGSMWDSLIETFNFGNAGENDRLELLSATEQKTVGQPLLNRITPLLCHALNCEVHLTIIPYAQQMDEQIQVLRIMADQIAMHEKVSLDITHGFRHLPMLALMSALYLRVIRQATIEGIYYGAFDPDTRDAPTPVYDLKGLLYMADWINALQMFDKDGDYGVFTDLLTDVTPQARDALNHAAFLERITRVGQARGKLKLFLDHLDQKPLQGIGSLFEPTLRERIEWCREDRFYQRQQALARHYLEQDDFLRATILAFEAFITRLIQTQHLGSVESRDIRATAKKNYEDKNRELETRDVLYNDYCLLRDLRNHLAHGNDAPRVEIQRALDNKKDLYDTISRLINKLLPENDSERT